MPRVIACFVFCFIKITCFTPWWQKKVLAISPLYLEGAALTCYKIHCTNLHLRHIASPRLFFANLFVITCFLQSHHLVLMELFGASEAAACGILLMAAALHRSFLWHGRSFSQIRKIAHRFYNRFKSYPSHPSHPSHPSYPSYPSDPHLSHFRIVSKIQESRTVCPWRGSWQALLLQH
jgi:hypothetical protein